MLFYGHSVKLIPVHWHWKSNLSVRLLFPLFFCSLHNFHQILRIYFCAKPFSFSLELFHWISFKGLKCIWKLEIQLVSNGQCWFKLCDIILVTLHHATVVKHCTIHPRMNCVQLKMRNVKSHFDGHWLTWYHRVSYQNSAICCHATSSLWMKASIHAVRCTSIQWLNQLDSICQQSVVRTRRQCTLPVLRIEKEEK